MIDAAVAVAAPDPTGQQAPLLDVRELRTHYATRRGVVRAVDGASFSLAAGETLGLVGESGCGKSNTALSIAGLIRAPGRVVAGEINFEGVDLLRLSPKQMRHVRGRKIGFVFQDPMTSLNPLQTVGAQIAETVRLNLGTSRSAAWDRAGAMLEQVGIPTARARLHDYPHQFSGGMRQRVVIAIALACNPRLLLADEPTTALDVTIQAQILDLIRQLSHEHRTAVLLITHDLGVAAEVCDRIAVMYAGRLVEVAETTEILHHPAMPYTRGLLDSMPRDVDQPGSRLRTINGLPPDGITAVDSCSFLERCRYARPVCQQAEPALISLPERPAHLSRCWGTAADGWIDE